MQGMILHNLLITLLLLAVLGGLWLVNFLMGLYVNMGLYEDGWNRSLFITSLKRLLFLLAATFLSVFILTILPEVLTYSGVSIETSIMDGLNVLAILGVLVAAIGVYGIQVVQKITEAFSAANGKPIEKVSATEEKLRE